MFFQQTQPSEDMMNYTNDNTKKARHELTLSFMDFEDNSCFGNIVQVGQLANK
jgi:hypothetical protein